jgi:tungstate transport system ATP-binding protein
MSILPLTATGATVRRRGKVLAGPVDVTLSGTGLTVVIGPNGAGKTTLLRMLHGIERLSSGRLAWAQPAIAARSAQAFVFQRPIIMRRTVRDNLAYPLQLTGLPKAEARKRAESWAERCHLIEALDRPARMLSGGEQQKLALGRALIRDPEVLFLDEPCANLDGRATREIETILLDARTRGTRILMSTHDMGQARRLADDVWFIYKGQIHENGPADSFFTQPGTPEARAFINGDLLE